MECRTGCGACCIAISISSPIPGMPHGKPAGVPCINLNMETYTCRIWNTPHYPEVCRNFTTCLENCGENREESLKNLNFFEKATAPSS